MGGSFLFNRIVANELRPFLLAVVCGGGPRAGFTAGVGAFLVMGLLDDLASLSLIVRGQTRIASGLAAMLNATIPLFTGVLARVVPLSALVVGTAVVGERLDVRHVAGTGLIGLGLAAMDGRPLRLPPRPASGERRRDRLAQRDPA